MQLYVHQKAGSDSRPVRELKGFERVGARAGRDEDGDASASAPTSCATGARERKWVQEAEAFDVWVGADSTAKLHADLAVVR